MKLSKLVQELESYIPKYETTNTAVSTSTVGWQIAHTFKVLVSIINTLEKSEPKTYQKKFNFIRTIILWSGKIPRGKAKAPKIVRPKEAELTLEALKEQVAVAQQALEKLVQLPSNTHFSHPVFGDLQKKDAIRFMDIHTQHHVNIVRDILSSSSSS